MPLFMDVHEIAGGVAMDDVEAPDAHQAPSTIGAIAIALAATALALPAWAQSGRPAPHIAKVASAARTTHATMTGEGTGLT